VRVIITGGSGLIGTALANKMTTDGHEIVVLSRKPESVPRLLSGVSTVASDGRSAEGWGALVDGAGAIINLSGENIGAGRWTSKRKHRILHSRTHAGQAVVRLLNGLGRGLAS
jgi:NAD dependent epimerase/dehydratase family enzyme